MAAGMLSAESERLAFGGYFAGKRALVTGHTGFKGSWLCTWLLKLGADVHGIALEPDTDPSLFKVLGLADRVSHHIGDVREYETVAALVREIRPECLFHLAAQPLVRLSYEIPLETLETNVMGTANVLQAVAKAGYTPESPCTVIVVTSDKCYENRETYDAYRETDSVGGFDVYSMSKGAAELVVSAWRRSFFGMNAAESPRVFLASCRAGNVIGGGDWASDRIVPDAIRSLCARKRIPVRNPLSVRPWQHVLEPLSGYLCVAALCGTARELADTLCSSWNFGPGRASERTVGDLCDAIVGHWGSGAWEHAGDGNAVHEAQYLKLAVDKAWHSLQWQPVWDFDATIKRTVDWYATAERSAFDASTMMAKTQEHIEEYVRSAKRLSVRWAESAE